MSRLFLFYPLDRLLAVCYTVFEMITTNKNRWIISTLSNDECSTDEQLLAYFIKEGPMTETEAMKWLKKRDFYRLNIVLDDGTVYNPKRVKGGE